MLLSALDITFLVAHTLLIAFNMVGWVWRRTRVFHLMVLGATALSWFVLGAVYGWGYCLCTDWHFRIRRQLGYPVPESSYIQLLIRLIFRVQIRRDVADRLAVGVFVAIITATSFVWTRDWIRKKHKAIA